MRDHPGVTERSARSILTLTLQVASPRTDDYIKGPGWRVTTGLRAAALPMTAA